ncbi:hypothetical protein OQI_20465 [Streptomyces pharetrae CZA14]|uniref:Uncharacterized protein n=1 Tax=Streptomyces pharetrae CZA14 TaxID=1144883 RepID=A0ABX3YFT9_9ACTN|nr:hypothetical protein OQI_20465 [Streptomyces pharetrae CZA14]
MTATEPDELTGHYGTARRIPPGNFADKPAPVDAWIISAPHWHPLWWQYLLAVVSLADIPGLPPACKHRPAVTHELQVMALNPDHGPYYPHDAGPGTLHHLTPVNIAEELATSDDQARRLAARCVQAAVDGILNPETADAPDRIRGAWRTYIDYTLLNLQHDPAS